MTTSTIDRDTATADTDTARPGALSASHMQNILARAPHYRAASEAPAVAHAPTVLKLWGGSLTPLMAAAEITGRLARAALTCPPVACTGLLRMEQGARSKAWRNVDAIENIFCLEGQLELRYGARLEQTLVLGHFDMVSLPAGVRHEIANTGTGPVRAVVVLSIPANGSYGAVFGTADADAALPGLDALGVSFDDQAGVEVDAETLATRVNRFEKLVPYKKDLNRTGGLPAEATEALSAGSVFTLIVPEGHVGRSRTAPIYGNQGLYMSLAECRTGDDAPPAHAHSDTQESFFILDGTFEVYTGFDNESAIDVGPGDIVSVPKQVMRTFRNTTGKPARILAIIQGGDKMRDFVSFSRKVGADFERRFGVETIEAYKQIGMTFDAEERFGL
ncbi:cupin domain-containing protein [Hydrogenophaga sp.]|uniref:cupin domain-containing protein n=1 Tax=Hydrogenophaga sp. TaxID=1904254 RepID=UPI0027258227|nr:cupin domain-containing protein [Hydrogenophaga sp.]MDO9436702.1 cupin domain-containing protein [Hydrogenophaga sp.]